MQTKDYSSEAFIQFVGGAHVRAYQFAYDEGHGLFGRAIHRAKPDGHPFEWKSACEYGVMYLLCLELIEASERRKLNRNEAGLFAEACAALVDQQLNKFLHHMGTAAHPMQGYPKYLASSVAEEFEGHGLFPRMVAELLAQERNKLFDTEEYIRKQGLLTMFAHPMRTFVEWLDRLEHDKAVDPAGYKQQYVMRRRVVALHRVGLAMLPPETWHNAVVA